MIARLESAGGRSGGQTCTDRHTGAKAFRQGHHIGLDPCILMSEPFSGTPDTALDLIEHQEPLPLVAQGAQGLQVSLMGNPNPAFTLDRLDQDGDDIVPPSGGSFKGGQIIEGDTHETTHEGLETHLNLLVARRRQRRQRTPMERLLHNHNRRLGNTATMPV